jgi:UDP-glucose 4-epimerase
VAGAAVVGSSAENLEQERRVYAAFLAELGDVIERTGRGDASLFLASSAGGVYAGSAGPPFTEATPVSPLAAYGETKLALEASTEAFVARTGVPALIGRISNLYGPGQDLAKTQGLISQLAKAYLLRTPIILYVSLDTMRDYLYVDDCARVVVRAVELIRDEQRGTPPTVKILASGRSTTIAELLGLFQRLFKRRAPLVLGDSPNRRWQVRDLRLRSEVWTDLDRFPRTPLPAGVGATVNDLAARLRAGELAPPVV